MALEDLLENLVDRGGSDLHLSPSSPPKFRIDGQLIDATREPLTPADTKHLVYGVLSADQIARFERELELDLSFGVSELGRFRVNVFAQRGSVSAVFRAVPSIVSKLSELGLPEEVCASFCSLPAGLVLVTGPTGSGKSTSLASMIDEINRTRQQHIVTIEDPIEFVHQNKRSLFNQRELHSDTHSFANALRSVLRQDPDVILIGEMRSTETIESALTLAETGHLTFATLHTSDAVQTINRIVDVFPAYQQQQIRTQLSFTLQGVISQQLLAAAGGRGRVLASEVLVVNGAVRALIRENKSHQIYSHMQTGARYGMRTMNTSLYELYRRRVISMDDALARSNDREELANLVRAGAAESRERVR